MIKYSASALEIRNIIEETSRHIDTEVPIRAFFGKDDMLFSVKERAIKLALPKMLRGETISIKKFIPDMYGEEINTLTFVDGKFGSTHGRGAWYNSNSGWYAPQGITVRGKDGAEKVYHVSKQRAGYFLQTLGLSTYGAKINGVALSESEIAYHGDVIEVDRMMPQIAMWRKMMVDAEYIPKDNEFVVDGIFEDKPFKAIIACYKRETATIEFYVTISTMQRSDLMKWQYATSRLIYDTINFFSLMIEEDIKNIGSDFLPVFTAQRVKTAKEEVERLESQIKNNSDSRQYNLRQITELSRKIQSDGDMLKYANKLAGEDGEEMAKKEWEEVMKLTPHMYTDVMINESGVLVAITQPVTINYDDWDFDMGEYIVQINMVTGELNIVSANGGDHNGHDHPHISSGKPCLGNIAEDLAKMIGEHQVTASLILINEYLHSVNEEGWYVSISGWDNEYEEHDNDDEDNEYDNCYENASAEQCLGCSDGDCSHYEDRYMNCWDGEPDFQECSHSDYCTRLSRCQSRCRENSDSLDCMRCENTNHCSYAGNGEDCHDEGNDDRCVGCNVGADCDCEYYMEEREEEPETTNEEVI